MPGRRDSIEADALVTDAYLESLLAARDEGPVSAAAFGWGGGDLDRGVRLASLRLRRDLPRLRPSFRFEERLALRLAEAAAGLRLARAVGGEGAPLPVDWSPLRPGEAAELAGLGRAAGSGRRRSSRPLLIGGAVASAALSLAGAALVAWRRGHPASPMARAVRAVRLARAGIAHPERAD